MKTLLTTGCSLALLSGCTIPKVQETINEVAGNEFVGQIAQDVIANAPSNPLDINGWIYALGATAVGAATYGVNKYLKKPAVDPLNPPENVQVK